MRVSRGRAPGQLSVDLGVLITSVVDSGLVLNVAKTSGVVEVSRLHRTEVFVSHRNARLTVHGRRILVQPTGRWRGVRNGRVSAARLPRRPDGVVSATDKPRRQGDAHLVGPLSRFLARRLDVTGTRHVFRTHPNLTAALAAIAAAGAPGAPGV